MEHRTLQVGTAALVFALLLRLTGGWEQLGWEAGNALLFLSTGRMAAQTLPGEETVGEPQPETVTELPVSEEAAVPVFGQLQEPLVQVSGEWPVDTAALLETPLNWQLKGDMPTVLILHTHATESYENNGGYQETSPYRTLDTDSNMVSIGERVAQLLEAGGVRVIHDRTLHDYPSYNNAYSNSRAAIEACLAEQPTLCLVLDLHRDASEDSEGKQKRETVELNGKTVARLMLVMGSDKGTLPYPNWETNLSLAVKLQAQLETDYPGLCRPVKLVASRYNQDLSTGALLVEVGTAGNTHEEALEAATLLAEGILALANGANLH